MSDLLRAAELLERIDREATPWPWDARKHTDTKGWTISHGNSIASVRTGRPDAALIVASRPLLAPLARLLRKCDEEGLDVGVGEALDALVAAVLEGKP
jgi:hypothetical protein